jgi:hypothetical protein
MAKTFDNDCHTASRFNCYLTPEIKELRIQLYTLGGSHILHNSVECARNIFGYSSDPAGYVQTIPGLTNPINKLVYLK